MPHDCVENIYLSLKFSGSPVIFLFYCLRLKKSSLEGIDKYVISLTKHGTLKSMSS